MKVICRIERTNLISAPDYACYFTFNIIDKGTLLTVRRNGCGYIIYDVSDISEGAIKRTRELITKLQDAIRNNTIKDLSWDEQDFAKRLKKVFYAVQDEFLSPDYEIILKHNYKE